MGRGSDSGEENGSLRKPWLGWYVLIELTCYRIIRDTLYKAIFIRMIDGLQWVGTSVIRDFHGRVTENYD